MGLNCNFLLGLEIPTKLLYINEKVEQISPRISGT